MTKKRLASNQDQTAVKIAAMEQAQFNCWELGITPSPNDDGRLFSRDEIRHQILIHASMDPLPNGKRLSKRLQAENALMEMLARSFEVHEFDPDEVPY